MDVDVSRAGISISTNIREIELLRRSKVYGNIRAISGDVGCGRPTPETRENAQQGLARAIQNDTDSEVNHATGV
jgi:hypothetical protein